MCGPAASAIPVKNAASQALPQTCWTTICILGSPGDPYALHSGQNFDFEISWYLGFSYQTGIVWSSLTTETSPVRGCCQDTNWMSPPLQRKQHIKRNNLPLWDVNISKPHFLSSFPVLSPTVMDMAGTLVIQKHPGTWGISKRRKCLGISVVSFGFSTAGRAQVAEMVTRNTSPATWTRIPTLGTDMKVREIWEWSDCCPEATVVSVFCIFSFQTSATHLECHLSRLFWKPLSSFHEPVA